MIGDEPLLRLYVEEDGRVVYVYPLLFGQASLGIGDPAKDYMDDQWEYPDIESAVIAALFWEPAKSSEPEGWTRHPATGRRRPDGDKSREFKRP